jgi:hypothetical protein
MLTSGVRMSLRGEHKYNEMYIFVYVDAKSALNAKHTASRTKLASHAQRAKDVPVNFS